MITRRSLRAVLITGAIAAAGQGQPSAGRDLPVRTDTIVGEVQGDHFGWRVVPVGDLNGDGIADLLVGAPAAVSGGEYGGRCYLFYGPLDRPMRAEQADAIFLGQAFGDNLLTGARIDANGDGAADIMLGAPGHDEPVMGAGRVYIFHGAVQDGLHQLDRADAIIAGESDFDGVGAVLASGDLNGDGLDDAILGCPGSGIDGRVFVLYGPLGRQQSVADADAIVTAALPFENLGVALAAEDINGDGQDDLIIGAPAAPINQLPPGRVYVLLGPVAGTMSAADADVIIEGEGVNDRLGSAAGVGDFDGDGSADVLVGADQFYLTEGAGRAYIFRGPLLAGRYNASAADAVLLGEATRDQFGFSAASAGDLNGDGIDDVVVGAPSYGDDNKGRAYFFLGPARGVVHGVDADLTVDGAPLDWVGYAVAGVGDVDGDGVGDVAVGAPAHPAANSAGVVTVVRPRARCRADFNGDGLVNTQDVLAFLNAWGADDASADFNGDGVIDTQDVLAFLNAWAGGC